MAPYYPILIGLLVLVAFLCLVGLLERFVWNKRQCPEAIKLVSVIVCYVGVFSAICVIFVGLIESGRKLLVMWHWLVVPVGVVAAVLMVGFWFVSLWTLMLVGWYAVDRYENGDRKKRRVIGFVVLLVAVFLWAVTTFR
jgi:hypothetical protein